MGISFLTATQRNCLLVHSSSVAWQLLLSSLANRRITLSRSRRCCSSKHCT
uniref:Uncharacterized protein n=1 Tax=Arundo donax TaxID=35708 RepID=A0A0A9GW70_ARUDO